MVKDQQQVEQMIRMAIVGGVRDPLLANRATTSEIPLKHGSEGIPKNDECARILKSRVKDLRMVDTHTFFRIVRDLPYRVGPSL